MTRLPLARGLVALLASEQKSRVEVIVVDNHSVDGTAGMVRERFPSVVLAANEVNLGHSCGCNQGMRLARGRHLFCLNSDAVMRSGALDTLVRYLDEHPDVGAVAPKVLNADGSIQGTIKSFPTPSAALFGRYSILTRLFPNNRWSRRYLVYLDRDFSRPFRCDSVSACAVMVSRAALQTAEHAHVSILRIAHTRCGVHRTHGVRTQRGVVMIAQRTVIQVGLAIISVPSFYVGMIGGLMIFIAVAIDAFRVRYFG